MEPNVLWTEMFLVMQRDCYQASSDARLTAAMRDLNDFLTHQPLPLAAALALRRPTRSAPSAVHR